MSSIQLPSTYQQLDWIQFTGSNYINTKVALNSNTKFKLKFSISDLSDTQTSLFGAYSSTTSRYIIQTANSAYNQLLITYGSVNEQAATIRGFNCHNINIIEVSAGVLKVNEVQAATFTTSTFSSSLRNFFLGAYNNSLTPSEHSYMRLYDCEIYSDGTTLSKHLIPCICIQTGTVGVYDIVNSSFISGSGTGDLVPGPMINPILPTGYTSLPYIQTSGAQYLNTNIIPHGNYHISIAFSRLDSATTGGLYCSRTAVSGTNESTNTLFYMSGSFREDYWGTTKSITPSYVRNDVIEYVSNQGGTIYLSNNLTATSFTKVLTTGTMPWILFASGISTDGTTITELDNYTSIKCYGCVIHNGASLAYRVFVPCLNSSQEAGLYDLKSKTFFKSATSTGFIAPSHVPLKIYPGNKLDFNFLPTTQEVTLEPGKYQLECWGAQGGCRDTSYLGGKGGYSKGTLTLTEQTTLFINTGGCYNYYKTYSPGGYNGGGTGKTSAAGGGGASDIRIGENSLFARVIVAGGGGGAGYVSNYGAGGGTHGGSGVDNTITAEVGSNRCGGGASQTAPGVGWSNSNTTIAEVTTGAFGYGGNAYRDSGYTAGGGGGGWYGGGGAYDNDSDSDGKNGGGGSGYVYTSSTASNYPSGCLLTSKYYLTDASTTLGTATIKSPTGVDETGHAGHGYVRITALELETLPKVETGDVFNFEYSGAKTSLTLPQGVYKLECWGAQGGSYISGSTKYEGGYGGYSFGLLTLNDPSTELFIYVGGQAASQTSSNQGTTAPGGFNGGGMGYLRYYSGTYSYSQGGGGASDIRIKKDSLYARVIVAGGGGGSSSDDAKTTKYGGGITSGSPTATYQATQTAAGTNGAFGIGADAYTNENGVSSYNYRYGAGAGGGGWYGGGASYLQDDSTSAYRGYNGGGSGYVYKEDTAVNYPTGCLLTAKYQLNEADTVGGNQSFPSPNSSAEEQGHSGHGYVRITVIKRFNLQIPIHIGSGWQRANQAYVKMYDQWWPVESLMVKMNGSWKDLAENVGIDKWANILQDFTYTFDAKDESATITGWKGTLNGQPSTIIQIPPYDGIKI